MTSIAIRNRTRSNTVPDHFRRRSHFRIAAEILENARTGTRKTQIMCKVGMNYSQLNEYLEFLEGRCMISRDEEIYRTTPKGSVFLEKLEALNLLFSS